MAKSDQQSVAAPPPGRLSGVLELEAPVAAARPAAGLEIFLPVAVLGALFVWLHWDLLDWLVQSWWQNSNWSHGFLLPLFSLYLLYCRWAELRTLREPELPGPRPTVVSNVAAAVVVAVVEVAAALLVWFLAKRFLFEYLWGSSGHIPRWILPVLLLMALVGVLWVARYGRQNRAATWLLFGQPCWGGLILVYLFLLLEVAITAIRPNNWLLGLSMIGMLFGLVMYFNGLRAMRLLWLPILFLCLAIPIPDSQYNPMAYRLQEVAAAGARQSLNLMGVEITRKASNLQLTSVAGKVCDLTVAEACSGMRLLMAFFALGVATAYLGVRPLWQRLTMVVAAIPIAVVCNVLRVAITGWMFYIDRPEWGKGILHTATGMLMLIPAFLLLWILGLLLEAVRWLGNRLFVEEPEAEPVACSSGSPAEKTSVGKGDGQ